VLKPDISLWSRESDLPGFLPMLERLKEYKHLIKEEKMTAWNAKMFDIDSGFWITRRWEFPWALAFLGDKPQCILSTRGLYDPFSLLLKDLGHSVTVVRERSPLMDDIDKRFAKKGIHFGEYDMVNLPFPDRKFDMVFCLSHLQYSSEDHAREVVKELLRVVKPGSPCIITVSDGGNTKWLVPDFEPSSDVMVTFGGRPVAGAVFRKEEDGNKKVRR